MSGIVFTVALGVLLVYVMPSINNEKISADSLLANMLDSIKINFEGPGFNVHNSNEAETSGKDSSLAESKNSDPKTVKKEPNENVVRAPVKPVSLPPDNTVTPPPGNSDGKKKKSGSGSSGGDSDSSSGSGGSAPQNTETTSNQNPVRDPAIFFESDNSYVSTDPNRIKMSENIFSSKTPTISFELDGGNCTGKMEDGNEFTFDKNGNTYSHIFGELEYGIYKVEVQCDDNVSRYFDFIVSQHGDQTRATGAGNG